MQPAVALVQAGYRSRFGHPAPSVLARYQAAGIAVAASPSCGCWRWQSESAEASCERARRQRYWSDRVALPMAPPPVAEGLAGPAWPGEEGVDVVN